MSGATDWDVIVVGAGHNGLAATALLAKRGLRVLCLEKNAYAGGMAGTREILEGCRNDVGASLLFPLAKGLAEELELEKYGVETIELPIMATNLNSKASPPAVFYASPLRMALYVLFFPCEAPKEERGKLRDEMAERILDRLSEYLPDLRECIVDRAVFSSDHFATMQGATNGDFTHGLIHPEQMIGGRLLVPGSAHATPIAGLWLCGASCHPGPGVTFLPGYGAAYEVAEALATADARPVAA